MKIWIVRTGINSKTFFDELSFNTWLSTTADSVSNKVVEVYEATPVERRTVKEIKDSIKESNIRESRIQAVLSEDPWFSKYDNFKSELEKYKHPEIHKINEKLNILGNDKEVIIKYLKLQKSYLLGCAGDDVKWFELLINLLGIRKMVNETLQKGNDGRWYGFPVTKKRKENFLKAKENVQKAV
jgi:hypothetical protein